MLWVRDKIQEVAAKLNTKEREELTVKWKLFVIFLMAVGTVFVVGCTSPLELEEVDMPDMVDFELFSITEVEDFEEDSIVQSDVPANVPFSEPHILSESAAAFIAELNSTGLNWSISDRQRSIDPYYHPAGHRVYIVNCSMDLVVGVIRLVTDSGSFWGDNHIQMAFMLQREPTKDEMSRLKKEGLLEWQMIWNFAGIFLDEEDCVAGIAVRSIDYLRDFPFRYYSGFDVTLLKGNKGNIDYKVVLSWDLLFEWYALYKIVLTVGMTEFYRELMAEFDFMPW